MPYPKVTHTSTHNTITYADPYKQCRSCGGWVDGALAEPGPLALVPCYHQSDYRDVCPSWNPVDGCRCAEYTASHPDNPISHAMRPKPAIDDGKVY